MMRNSETDAAGSRTNLFGDYVDVFSRRRKTILAATAAAFVISAAAGFILPDIYRARAMVIPVPEDKGLVNAMMSQLGGLATLAGAPAGGTSTADLYVTMLKSESIKDSIIDRFRLMQSTGEKYRGDLYLLLDKKVSVSAGRKDGVVSITVEDRDPKKAADIANSYVEELQKLTVRLTASGAGKNRSFLDERLAHARADLSLAEEKLKAFLGRTKGVNISEQAKATIEGIAQLRAQLAVQEVQLGTLRRQFTDGSQEVKNATASIANLKTQIGKLEGSGGGAIPAIGSVPALGEEYVRLMREVKIQESLVEALTKQAEIARLTEAKDVAPIQVLQTAQPPDRKVKPKRLFIIVSSTFTVFLLSLVFALVAERMGGMLPSFGRGR